MLLLELLEFKLFFQVSFSFQHHQEVLLLFHQEFTSNKLHTGIEFLRDFTLLFCGVLLFELFGIDEVLLFELFVVLIDEKNPLPPNVMLPPLFFKFELL